MMKNTGMFWKLNTEVFIIINYRCFFFRIVLEDSQEEFESFMLAVDQTEKSSGIKPLESMIAYQYYQHKLVPKKKL